MLSPHDANWANAPSLPFAEKETYTASNRFFGLKARIYYADNSTEDTYIPLRDMQGGMVKLIEAAAPVLLSRQGLDRCDQAPRRRYSRPCQWRICSR